jgi:ankyrin repeat protein
MIDNDPWLGVNLDAQAQQALQSLGNRLHISPQQDNMSTILVHAECMGPCRSLWLNMLMSSYPTSLQQANARGELPLHLLLQNRASLTNDAIRMMNQYPAALRMTSVSGYIPLHIECYGGCRNPILKRCIELCRDSLSTVGNEGFLPLHYLVCNPKSTVVNASTIIEPYPEALHCFTTRGELPIHLESYKQCRSDMLSTLIEYYPESLLIPNKSGLLPLHLALRNNTSSITSGIILMLKCPEALLQKSSNGYYLPIHIECMYRCRSVILSKCMECPESLAVADVQGCLPLHSLIANPASSADDVLAMIDKFVDALRYVNAEDNLPMHLECARLCRSRVLSKYIELFPDALVVANQFGNLPLHFLLNNPASLVDDAIAMIESYPEALLYRCQSGDTPIVLECIMQCRSQVLLRCIEIYPKCLEIASLNQFLPLHWLLANEISSANDAVMMIEAYPAALSHMSSSNNLPIHIECKCQCRHDILEVMINLFHDCLSMANDVGMLPLHLALYEDITAEDSSDAILMLIERYPEAVKAAVYERLPIHLECDRLCRSSILAKCIEYYLESLTIADQNGSLPLHLLLCNPHSEISDALMMIDEYPRSLRTFNNFGDLPIHVECTYRCRQEIVRKCIEEYPESFLISNWQDVSPLEIMLMKMSDSFLIDMVCNYPEVLRIQDMNGRHALHIMCAYPCSHALLSKCIALYPEALTACDVNNDIPWTTSLYYLNEGNIRERRKSLSLLLSGNPESFYHPADNPVILRIPFMSDRRSRRMILNLLPSCLSAAAHIQAYRDVNWHSRSSLLHLLLRLQNRFPYHQSYGSSLERLFGTTTTLRELPHNDISTKRMILDIISMSSLFSNQTRVEDDVLDYKIHRGNSVGDLMLRFIFSFL